MNFLLPISPVQSTAMSGVLRHIAQLVVERKVQFLCGAGMSKASGCPLAQELSAELLKDLLGDMSENDRAELLRLYQFEAIASAFLEIKDSTKKKTKIRVFDLVANDQTKLSNR